MTLKVTHLSDQFVRSAPRCRSNASRAQSPEPPPEVFSLLFILIISHWILKVKWDLPGFSEFFREIPSFSGNFLIRERRILPLKWHKVFSFKKKLRNKVIFLQNKRAIGGGPLISPFVHFNYITLNFKSQVGFAGIFREFPSFSGNFLIRERRIPPLKWHKGFSF